ncbi:DUF1338 domain-containing protein [soil metagenome]
MHVDEFFKNLWEDYTTIAPAAKVLHHAVEARGETLFNDHVAFRTFDQFPINLERLEKHILALGYERYEPYKFEDKKLRAYGYIHPEGKPRVFLSELETSHFSPRLQAIVKMICSQIDPKRTETADVLYAGRLWNPVPYDIYKDLIDESEYAAWVAAMGLRANHFTISVNHLKTLTTLEQLLEFVESCGYKLNARGGRVKGNPSVLLEQGSTLADKQEVEFAFGEKHVIPTCYYEFARRYNTPNGELYSGFVAASADKIFESTNVKV